MNNVLFLNVPGLTIKERENIDTDSVWNRLFVPQGILSIISYHSAIAKNNCRTFFVEDLREKYYEYKNDEKARLETEKFIIDLINEQKPDFILLSCVFNTCYFHLDYVFNAINKTNTSAKVVMGGGYVTTQYKNIFKEFSRVNYLVLAEGEIGVNSILTGQDIDNHKSIVTKESLQNGIIPEPEFVCKLDDIPMFDYSLIHNKIYDTKSIIFNTSRGCPFNCIFCAAYLMAGKKIRAFSENRVKNDFDYYYDKGYRDFFIFDENFLFDKDRAVNILQYMLDRSNGKISVSFPSGVMVARIDDTICNLLSKLNVKDVPLALENGSERVLHDIIQKPVKISDFERSVQLLRTYNIDVHVFIVSGLPGETDEDRRITSELLKKVGVTWASFNVAMPLIGSRLLKLCKEKGYLLDDGEKNHQWGEALISLPDYSPDYLKEAVYRMNLDVNFINNYDMLHGHYEKVITKFKHFSEVYKDHAFAHICYAYCLKKIGKNEMAKKEFFEYEKILRKEKIWENRRFACEKDIYKLEQVIKEQ